MSGSRGPLLRAFRLLLRLHPAEQRRRYGREMEQVFGAVLETARRRGGRRAVALAAARELWAVAATGVRDRVDPGGRRGGAEMRLLDDVRHAWRTLASRPFHALGTAMVVALGVGAHTLIFAVVDPVLLDPRTRGGGSPLVAVWTHGDDPERGGPGIGTELLFELREESPVFRILEGYTQGRAVLGGDEDPEWVSLMRASPGFLDVFGVRPALGSDLRAGGTGERVALLSHDLWKQRFGGRREVLGRSIDLDGERHTVVGVLPRGFHFRDRGPAVWVPVPDAAAPDAPAGFFAVGWLREGLTVEAADSALELRVPELREAGVLGEGDHPWVLESVFADTPDATRRALAIFFGAVTFILLVAAGNALGLEVARALARRPEAAVRSALGCGAGRLARHFVLEGALVGLAGGALGFGAAAAGLEILVPLLPDQLRMVTFGSGLAVGGAHLAWALGLGLAIGVVVGAVGALVARPGGRVRGRSGPTTTGDRLTTGLRRGLVVAQVAFSFVLLAGSAVLGRSFLELTRVERGYASDEILLAELRAPRSVASSAGGSDAFFSRVRERLEAAPGVQAVGETTSPLPLSSARFRASLTSDADRTVEPGDVLPYDPVGSGYFRAAGIELTHGAELEASDPPGSVVVGAAMARALWPDGRGVGRRFRVGEGEWLTVVGVAEDVPHMGLRGTAHGMAYYQRLEDDRRRGPIRVFLIRTSGDPGVVAPAVRAALREVQPGVPFQRLLPMEEVFADSIARERFYAALMGLFAAVAAALAALGLYASLAQHVGGRTREIGVRMALGADPSRVFTRVVWQGAALVLLGIAIGLGGALLLSRVLESVLFGVGPNDPLAMAATAVFFLAVAVVACAAPGWRAVCVDPVRALAAE